MDKCQENTLEQILEQISELSAEIENIKEQINTMRSDINELKERSITIGNVKEPVPWWYNDNITC